MTIFNERQKEIADKIDSDVMISMWKDWTWQLKHTVRDLETFEYLSGIRFSRQERIIIKKTLNIFPLSVTPYYLSLVDEHNPSSDPIFRQSFPDASELIMEQYDMEDPLHEEEDSPVPGITHRYPDRVLLVLTSLCSMYCRHCTRRRFVGK